MNRGDMVRFGSFEFDPATRRVRREGVDIHLAPKAFDLLAALLDAAPSVVPKRELHARLWPGGVVADATLVALVKQLRAALSERDRAAPLIRTVHRVGYALDLPPVPSPATSASVAACWLMLGEQRLPLRPGENLVGRDQAAQVRLDDAVVSRRHALIIVTPSGALLRDLGSKNGTSLGGVPVAGTVPLRQGAQLLFGTVPAVYGETGTGSPTLTHVVPATP